MKTKRFKLSKNDDIKATLFNKDGKLLSSVYDSGFSSLSQIKSALLSKIPNPPRETYFSVVCYESDKFWSNRIK